MKWFLFALLIGYALGLQACVATEDGFIMHTADPAWGVQFRFPVPPLASHDPEPLPGEVGIDEEPTIGATPSCEMVKANISSDGRKLYHVPGMPNYNQVKIDEAAGERFFCTEAEAIEAGWTKAGGQ